MGARVEKFKVGHRVSAGGSTHGTVDRVDRGKLLSINVYWDSGVSSRHAPGSLYHVNTQPPKRRINVYTRVKVSQLTAHISSRGQIGTVTARDGHVCFVSFDDGTGRAFNERFLIPLWNSLKPTPFAQAKPVEYLEKDTTKEERIVDPKTGGEKGQKQERWELLPFPALDEVARVYGYGARKYAPDNWRKGYSWRLSLGALCRHIALWASGQSVDPETGCHHLAHATFHCLALITFEDEGLGTDDRAKGKHAQAK